MKKRQHGLTLIELMTGIGIVAILAAIAVPSFREYTRNTRVTTAQNDLVTGLALSRSESLRRGRAVTICPSTNGETCDGDDDWSVGWIVFVDDIAPFGARDAANEELLQVWTAYPAELVLEADVDSIRYLPTGRVDAAGTANFAVQTDGCTGEKARAVAVSVVGFATSEKAACT